MFSPRDSLNINNPESSLNKGKFSRYEDKPAVNRDSSVVEEEEETAEEEEEEEEEEEDDLVVVF